ncbi:MAG: cysteine hydrolase family protein [Crinalium sp.]
MNPEQTAIVLIGFQNDYFATDGILHNVIEESTKATNVVVNTVNLVQELAPTPALIITTPIFFTSTYDELVEPVGILNVIKEYGAFQAGSIGSEMTPELVPFKDRITEVPGKRGLNAFSNTELNSLLRSKQITNFILAGAVTSVCIDSTGRYAHELGYQVSVLSDCTSARTNFEQDFYCNNIFPLYANVMSHAQLLDKFKTAV